MSLKLRTPFINKFGQEVSQEEMQNRNEKKTLGRIRRFHAKYVGANFDAWEKKAMDKGLIADGGIVEVLYHKDSKKKEIFMRKEEQEEGFVEQFVPELLKDLKAWTEEEHGGTQCDMKNLVKRKPWVGNFLHKDYPDFMKKGKRGYYPPKDKKKKKKADEEDSDDDDKLSTPSMNPPSRKSSTVMEEEVEEKKIAMEELPLYSYKDMVYTLQKGMELKTLVQKIVRLNHSTTTEELRKHRRDLEEVADLVSIAGWEEGVERATELEHEPMRAPAPKRKLPQDFEGHDEELGIDKLSNAKGGETKEVKSNSGSTIHSPSHDMPRKESDTISMASTVKSRDSPNKKAVTRDECIEAFAQYASSQSRTLFAQDWKEKNPELAQKNANILEKLQDYAKGPTEEKKLDDLAKGYNLAYNVVYLENGGSMKLLKEYYKERGQNGSDSWCDDSNERWLFKFMEKYLKVVLAQVTAQSGGNLKS